MKKQNKTVAADELSDVVNIFGSSEHVSLLGRIEC